METYKTLGLSTGHITEKDSEVLQELSKASNMIFSRDTGFFIKIYTDKLELNTNDEYSKALISIIKYAYSNNFKMIELDCDIELSEKFKSFNW